MLNITTCKCHNSPTGIMVSMPIITNGKCHKSHKSPLAYGIDAKYHHWQMSQKPNVPSGIWNRCLISPLANVTTAKCPYWHMLLMPIITTGECHNSQMSQLAYGKDAKYHHWEMSLQANDPTGYQCTLNNQIKILSFTFR